MADPLPLEALVVQESVASQACSPRCLLQPLMPVSVDVQHLDSPDDALSSNENATRPRRVQHQRSKRPRRATIGSSDPQVLTTFVLL